MTVGPDATTANVWAHEVKVAGRVTFDVICSP